MALSHALAERGHAARAARAVSATVTFRPANGHHQSRALEVDGTVPGLDDDGFVEAAEGAKDELPRLEGADGERRAARERAACGRRPLTALARRAGARAPGLPCRWPWPTSRSSSRSSSAPTRAPGADGGPCRLQRPPRGGGGRAAPEGARGRRTSSRRSGGGATPTSRPRAGDPELRELVPELEERLARLEEELKLALVERDPADAQGRDRRGPPGRRRRRGGALGGRGASACCTRYAERRGFKIEELSANPNEGGGVKEVDVRGQGRRRVLGLQVGGRHAPRAARPGDRVAGAHPHLDRDRGRDARGRGGRGRDRREGPEDRRLPLDRARAARASTRPTRPCGSRTCRPASSSRCRTRSRSSRTSRRRCACSARGCYEAERERQQAELGARARSQVGTGERAEKIRTYNFPENRLTDHRVKRPCTGSTRSSRASSTSSPRRSRPRSAAARSRTQPPA